ncbi:PqqD family protein [Deinococcus roseus]|uniref:PqqD family protein n=1 Tax=Deinococcus roseus TaxID=392414 RepID=A0ABQ2CZ70_9DEIO|nr:PqqD family protein [Deinococcus roseus]GGJ28324.1 hypothetical protein GCM10008938_13000 [Deinococcus roseus]
MYRPKQDILVTDLQEELVLLNPDTQDIYTLNLSGRLLWLALPATLDSLADLLMQHYELDPQTAQTDALEIVEALVSSGLVQHDP